MKNNEMHDFLKRELINCAKAGFSPPQSETPTGEILSDLLNPRHRKFDMNFAQAISDIRPDWIWAAGEAPYCCNRLAA